MGLLVHACGVLGMLLTVNLVSYLNVALSDPAHPVPVSAFYPLRRLTSFPLTSIPFLIHECCPLCQVLAVTPSFSL